MIKTINIKTKRILFILLTTISFSIYAQNEISVKIINGDILELINEIESKTDFKFIYSEKVSLSVPVSISAENSSVENILQKAVNINKINYNIKGKYIVLTTAKPKPITISGHITDKESEETLIGATIFDVKHHLGTNSNGYGFYSITLPAGDAILKISYVGYKTLTIDDSFLKDTIINIKLENNMVLKDIVILSEKKESDFHSTHTGAINVPLRHLKHNPALLGGGDVIKTLQMLPGVNSGIEGLSGMYVRGGGAEQNLYRLDGVSIYNIDHVMGINSIFSPEAVKRVDMYKGSFPARFGGRLSSVLDVYTKDGDMYNYHGAVSIGILSSKINFEGPIFKGKDRKSVV